MNFVKKYIVTNRGGSWVVKLILTYLCKYNVVFLDIAPKLNEIKLITLKMHLKVLSEGFWRAVLPEADQTFKTLSLIFMHIFMMQFGCFLASKMI